MKKYVRFLWIFLFFVNLAWAEAPILKPPPFPFQYHTRTGEAHELSFTLVMLDEDAFREAERYYFGPRVFRRAFTISWREKKTNEVYHIIMYINKNTPQGEPPSSDIGHEVKHLIDNQYFFENGQRFHRFSENCKKWKECHPDEQ